MKSFVLGVSVLSLGALTACGGGSVAAPVLQRHMLKADVAVNSATNGPFNLVMSTSFQPAEWDYQFFQTFPGATAPLSKLQPHHIRLQGISRGVPQGAQGTPWTSWDFSVLDAITQPVLGVGDHSPEFQIAKAPPFMYADNDSAKSFNDLTFQQFAGYAKNLVEYYDTGGFTDSNSVHHVSPAWPNETVTWWGIYNEPSINNNLTATDYVTMYNAVVPAMQSADANIKFVALEMCCTSESWARTFAQNVTPGLPVDAVATHYYSSCDQKDSDDQLMGTVPGFAASVQTIYNNLSVNAALTNVPVWITENNVNADFDIGGGISACNGGPFVTDQRGSSAFFAAWRPYVFSQVGKAGAQALYHWDFDADAQYGEVDFGTGQTQLSYWVDYWLGQMFPAGTNQELLQFTNSDDTNFEVLPVKNSDGSFVVMISNHAVASAVDNDGVGVPATVSLNVSELGGFASASLVMINSSTSAATGPSPEAISPTSPITVDMNGYSVAMIKLQ